MTGALDVFVLASGTFSIAATFPLLYLAVRSVRDARSLRDIQYELAGLMRDAKEIGEEVHKLQREIRHDQQAAKSGIDETKRTVEQVTQAVEQAAEQIAEVAAKQRRSRRIVPILASQR